MEKQPRNCAHSLRSSLKLCSTGSTWSIFIQTTAPFSQIVNLTTSKWSAYCINKDPMGNDFQYPLWPIRNDCCCLLQWMVMPLCWSPLFNWYFWRSQKMGKQISWPLNTHQVTKQNRTAFSVSVNHSLLYHPSLSLPFSKEEFRAWSSFKAYFFSDRQGLWCHPWQTVLSIFCSYLGYSRMCPSLPGTIGAHPHPHPHQYYSPARRNAYRARDSTVIKKKKRHHCPLPHPILRV